MAPEAGQYTMQCWHSTRNPENTDRAKVLLQCLQLIKELQKGFKKGEIAIPSADMKEIRKGIEICILYRPQKAFIGDIHDSVNKIANELSLEYRDFVKQDTGVNMDLTQDESENLSILGKPVPNGLAVSDIQKLLDSAKQSGSFEPANIWRMYIHESQRTPPFWITRKTLHRFHNSDGNALEREVESILKGIQQARDYTKTSYQVVALLTKGVVATVGNADVGGPLAGSWAALGAGTIGYAIGTATVAVLGPLALVLGPFVGLGVYLAKKIASNVLLVINDTQNNIMPLKEHIENGERTLVPNMIPAAIENGDFVPCGIFIYSKKSTGAYGSAFGVSFNCSGNDNFSIGMDCPNSSMGGNNSIEVHRREHAYDACKMALKSGCMHGWCNHPYVDVKIADHWGDVNWGRAIVMRD